MSYREDLARTIREGERASRKLTKLNELPDFGEFPNGTVLAVSIAYPSGDPYTYIGYKNRDLWYFTGSNSPNHANPDEVVEWLVKGPRRVLGVLVIAELDVQVIRVPSVNLGAMLDRISAAATAFDRSYGG